MSSFSPVATSIQSKLESALSPLHLEVLNESHMHNVPKDAETHFKLFVVSETFSKLNPIQRHRRVNSILKEELDGPVHALSIIAKTPTQYEAMQRNGAKIPASPACRGGDGSLPPTN